MSRVFLLGLDCATPQLLFDEFYDSLPNLSRLISHGTAGYLRSTVPPVTVPAWMSMMTGMDPGQLGFYGFSDRADHSYDNNYIVTHRAVHHDAIWDHVGKQGKRSVVFNVPLTYPPKRINGIMVSSFLTPDKELPFTIPASIKEELDEIADGNYIIDVGNFRTTDKERLLEELYEMAEKRFKILNNFVRTKDWQFFAAVEMGIDRLHHGFWRYAYSDEESGLRTALRDYYVFIDGLIGNLVRSFDDDTELLIASDHGARSLKGTFCINDWLIEKGYLVLKEGAKGSRLLPSIVDWERTRVWASGGYYCKLYLNMKGREPDGIVDPSNASPLLSSITSELSELVDPDGVPLENDHFIPEKIYSEVNGIPPDMFVYIGKLEWRVTGNIGNSSYFLFENTAIDNANHDINGIVVRDREPRRSLEKNEITSKSDLGLGRFSILDVAPTVLDTFGIDVPRELSGDIIK